MTVQHPSREDQSKFLRLLTLVEELRRLGVQEKLSLPQLVVVGDQSSGKSSILNSMFDACFPVSSTLCTRYATQLDMRRSTNPEDAKVSIIPGPSVCTNEEQAKSLAAFQFRIPAAHMDESAFSKIFSSASRQLGLPEPGTTTNENIENRFSDSVLKIELAGPHFVDLSIVDIPGLFHNPQARVQTAEDKATIRKIINGYMANERTIILAIMDGRVNLANQEVFSMAQSADKSGNRTIGIITKCDAINEGDEQPVIDIALNKVAQLKHGWFVVRNRSTKDIQERMTSMQRAEKEATFFSQKPWNQIPKSRVGIEPLSTTLQDLLNSHIQRELPHLIEEIQGVVDKHNDELKKLPPPRDTIPEKRTFLQNIATDFQALVISGSRGNYSENWQEDALKIRKHIQYQNDYFARTICAKGHSVPFDSSETMAWLKKHYLGNRGAELPGTADPALMELLFRLQAKPWHDIAKAHIEAISEHVKNFQVAALKSLTKDDDHIAQRLGRLTNSIHKEALANANEALEKLIEDEMAGILQTGSTVFWEKLGIYRRARFMQRLQSLGAFRFDQDTLNRTVIPALLMEPADQVICEAHDILKAYYEVAIRRFIENVYVQVVERTFLGSKAGPLQALNRDLVSRLSDNEVDDLAAENSDIRRQRLDTQNELDRFEKALRLVQAES